MARVNAMGLAWTAAKELAATYGGKSADYMVSGQLLKDAIALKSGKKDLLDLAREYKVLPASFEKYVEENPADAVFHRLEEQMMYWMAARGTWRESSFAEGMATLYRECLQELESMGKKAVNDALRSVTGGRTVYEQVMEILDEVIIYYTPDAISQMEDRLQEVYTLITEADTSEEGKRAREKISESVARVSAKRPVTTIEAADDLSSLFL